MRLSPETHRRASTLARVKRQILDTVVTKELEEYLSDQGVQGEADEHRSAR